MASDVTVTSPAPTTVVTSEPKKKLSMAMKFYLEKKREHDSFIAQERSEFELGKKHLANMMGMEVEAMTQEDIDKAIDYLFPSGLFHPEARPVMKPPEDIFPKQKDAEFDEDGRPYHPFFYCIRPNYVQTMYQLVDHLENITFFGDRMKKQNRQPDPDLILNETVLSSTKWMEKAELDALLMEELKEDQYKDFITAIERLVEHPFSYRVKDFVFKFRSPLSNLQSMEEFITPEYDEQGKAFVEAIGQRKSSLAKVRVTKPGTGMFSLTHIDFPEVTNDITYFFSIKERHQVMYPLQFTKMLGSVDVSCIVSPGGVASQAGAIRYATSLCLRSFVDSQTLEEMRLAGLLTQDVRVPERKKPGQEKARRKYTWKRR